MERNVRALQHLEQGFLPHYSSDRRKYTERNLRHSHGAEVLPCASHTLRLLVRASPSSSTSSDAMSACGEGYYSEIGEPSCTRCPAGHYCPQADAGPISCLPGYYRYVFVPIWSLKMLCRGVAGSLPHTTAWSTSFPLPSGQKMPVSILLQLLHCRVPHAPVDKQRVSFDKLHLMPGWVLLRPGRRFAPTMRCRILQ